VNRGLLHALLHCTTRRRCRQATKVRRLARRRADAKRLGGIAERSLDQRVSEPGSPITQIADNRTAGRIAHALERCADRTPIQPRAC